VRRLWRKRCRLRLSGTHGRRPGEVDQVDGESLIQSLDEVQAPDLREATLREAKLKEDGDRQRR